MNPFRRIKSSAIPLRTRGDDWISRSRWPYGGLSFTLDELVRLSGLPRRVIKERLKQGWTVEAAVLTPGPKKRPLAGPGVLQGSR